ncbi:conserved Plasmodium protein, unknown function [Plasmodium malariae]|uniref:Uncharacterized protein n=1 Tax=Plasmodium malariae TaxID=5858 RepID=A0A1D3TCQ0_PLAMA|nr:conserved Plasmodium protein, unknown function [Plasmodium malariae]SCP02643.1 conserved Plasmodium protein, unknown function [Plasmodium malariae]
MGNEKSACFSCQDTLSNLDDNIKNMDMLWLYQGSKNANVEADVEADVEANVEADVEADVEANVEADVEANVEADVEANVDDNIAACARSDEGDGGSIKEEGAEIKEYYNYAKESSKKILESHVNEYQKELDKYKKDPKCKIDPTIHIGNTEEIENYVITEKIYITTYIQYIDIYEDAIDVNEDIEKEEVEYVEVPKYVTKYVPKVVTNYMEKIIEIPSGEEIKRPQYNNVNVPYIIPKIVEKEIEVVLKKIIKPEIEITNEELEIEVLKYIPRIVPVNVYVPRYFGLSAKVKGEEEKQITYVSLSDKQIDQLMKDLNPHLDELKIFNENQTKKMHEYIKESQTQAHNHNLQPPQPQLVAYDEYGNCNSYDYSEFYRFEESCAQQLNYLQTHDSTKDVVADKSGGIKVNHLK